MPVQELAHYQPEMNKPVNPEEPEGYIPDPARAQVMAYASKESEEYAVTERKIAHENVKNLGKVANWAEANIISSQGRFKEGEHSPDLDIWRLQEATKGLELAKTMSLEADRRAKSAAHTYDRQKERSRHNPDGSPIYP